MVEGQAASNPPTCLPPVDTSSSGERHALLPSRHPLEDVKTCGECTGCKAKKACKNRSKRKDPVVDGDGVSKTTRGILSC
jgi:hypothetical protein